MTLSHARTRPAHQCQNGHHFSPGSTIERKLQKQLASSHPRPLTGSRNRPKEMLPRGGAGRHSRNRPSTTSWPTNPNGDCGLAQRSGAHFVRALPSNELEKIVYGRYFSTGPSPTPSTHPITHAARKESRPKTRAVNKPCGQPKRQFNHLQRGPRRGSKTGWPVRNPPDTYKLRCILRLEKRVSASKNTHLPTLARLAPYQSRRGHAVGSP